MLSATPTDLVPAHPETFLLIGTLENDQFTVGRACVLAWALDSERLVPVTVAGPNHGRQEMLAVLQPDGRVEVPDGSSYANLDEWRRVAVKRARAEEIKQTP